MAHEMPVLVAYAVVVAHPGQVPLRTARKGGKKNTAEEYEHSALQYQFGIFERPQSQ
jgi:hypothetical protein